MPTLSARRARITKARGGNAKKEGQEDERTRGQGWKSPAHAGPASRPSSRWMQRGWARASTRQACNMLGGTLALLAASTPTCAAAGFGSPPPRREEEPTQKLYRASLARSKLARKPSNSRRMEWRKRTRRGRINGLRAMRIPAVVLVARRRSPVHPAVDTRRTALRSGNSTHYCRADGALDPELQRRSTRRTAVGQLMYTS